jgi:Nif-specific regulatory protein
MGFAIVGFVILSIFYFRNVQPRIDAFFMPHSYDRDRVLYEFAAEVARLSGLPLDQAADRIIRAFVRLLDLKGAAVYYARPDHNHLLLKSEGMESEIDSLFHKNALRFPNQWPSLHDPARPGKSWFASLPIRCENPAWAHNSLKHTYAKTHSDLSHFLKRAAGAHIDLALPILHEKQGVALFLLGRKKNGKPFFENDLQLIRNLAATLSIGLWNSFLYEQLRNRAEAIQHENLALVNVSRNLARSVVSVKAGRDLVYISDAMHQVMERLRLAAKTEITVLLLGESGTGKELAATLIHNKSERSEGPFVAINCAAIPEMLLESELFGHEKGAFTGADRKREGRFEESNAGTLFLDEIGELTPALQAKLLRVLQEKSFCRVGGNTSIRWSGRLILATHRNLEEMIQEKAFRKDLYYRINAFPIQLPPLRERREDIIPMVDYLLPRYKRELKKGKLTVAEEARRLLINYDWPGNVRELENVLSGAAIVCKGDVITSRDLPDHLITRDASPESQIYEAGRSFSSIIREQEILLLKAALQSAKGNKTEAAQLLRLNRNTFTYKVKQYGLG